MFLYVSVCLSASALSFKRKDLEVLITAMSCPREFIRNPQSGSFKICVRL